MPTSGNGEKKLTAMALCSGSRGDCQPITAVLLALKKNNWNVVFFTNPEHEALVRDAGIGFEENGNPFKACFTSEAATKAFSTDDFLSWVALQNENDLKFADVWYSKLWAAIEAHKPDLLLTSVQHWCDSFALPLLLRIPTLHLNLANSFTLDVDRAPFGLPSAPPGENRPIWEAVYYSYLQGVEAGPGKTLERLSGKAMRHWFPTRDEFLEVVSSWPGFEDIRAFMPSVFLLDDSARTKLDREWFVFTGSPSMPQEQSVGTEYGEEQKEELEAFLARCDAPPVYMGWGSMTCGTAQEMTTKAVRALMILKKPGVVLGGWAALSESALEDEELRAYAKKNVLFLKAANHGTLFPRCSVIVHHGGVGTTGASLRSGVVTIVTPVFYDQFDSGKLVEELKVGAKTEQLGKLTAEDLAESVQKCIEDEGMAQRAKEYAEKVAGKQGAEEAAKVIDGFWRDCVGSGKYWQGFDKIAERKEANWRKKEGEA